MKPTFVIHDVLQVRLLSPSQEKAVEERSMFDWFKYAVKELKGQRLKLAVIANGIDLCPEWVEMIKKNEWEVQCHGLFHHTMKYLDESEAVRELSEAKGLIEKTFNQKVTQFYPPKLAWSHNLFDTCTRLGITMMMDRWRPVHALEGENIPEIYIHHWNQKNVEDAVKLCRERGWL